VRSSAPRECRRREAKSQTHRRSGL
jgi:hypothetical protein